MNDNNAIAGYLASLTADGFDVTVGMRKIPAGAGFYASLEHLSLTEPEEFYGDTIRGALHSARRWASALNPASAIERP